MCIRDRYLNPFLVLRQGTLQRFPLAFLLGFAGVGQFPGNGFPIGQGSLGALPDFVQDKVVKGIVFHPVLGAMVLAERPIGCLLYTSRCV